VFSKLGFPVVVNFAILSFVFFDMGDVFAGERAASTFMTGSLLLSVVLETADAGFVDFIDFGVVFLVVGDFATFGVIDLVLTVDDGFSGLTAAGVSVIELFSFTILPFDNEPLCDVSGDFKRLSLFDVVGGSEITVFLGDKGFLLLSSVSIEFPFGVVGIWLTELRLSVEEKLVVQFLLGLVELLDIIKLRGVIGVLKIPFGCEFVLFTVMGVASDLSDSEVGFPSSRFELC